VSKWNNLSSQQRCDLWKDFRNQIASLDKEQQKESVADFFRDVPIGTRSIDFYTPEAWPLPWEILYYEEFCENTISLLIYYTLKLLDHDVAIWLIDDGSDRFLVAVVDNQDVLNYELGTISKLANLQSNLKVLDTFDKQIKQIS
jgi:hypothetical protein